MGVYKYDNESYDINENDAKLEFWNNPITIPPKSRVGYQSNINFGYSSIALYCLDILSGIVHAVEDYNYKSLIGALIKETYKDSSGNLHSIYKYINLGAYVVEKNKAVNIKHLTPMYCGQLIGIRIYIFNNSAHSITIKGFKLYKAMDYSNAYIENDLTEYKSDRIVHIDDEDVGDGTTELVFKNQLTSQFSSYYDSIEKLNDLEYWFTSSKWFARFWRLASSGQSYTRYEYNWKAFDDKGNLIGTNGEDGINLPDYSEYMIFYFNAEDIENIDGKVPNLIIFMNNLGRKYGGTAETYHYRFIDALDKDYGAFDLYDYPNDIEANEKYDNGSGVLTFQLVIESDDGSTTTRYFYCSPQPFSYFYGMTNHVSEPYIINGHVYWFLQGLKLGNTVDGEEYVSTSMIDVETCSAETFKAYLDDWGNVGLKFYTEIFGEALKNLIYIDDALEKTYPDGNINSDSGGGAW